MEIIILVHTHHCVSSVFYSNIVLPLERGLSMTYSQYFNSTCQSQDTFTR